MSKLLFSFESDAVLDPTGKGVGGDDSTTGVDVVDGVKESVEDIVGLNIAIEELQLRLEDGVRAVTEVSDISDLMEGQVSNNEGMSPEAAQMVTIALESIAKRLDIKVPFHRVPSLEHFVSKASRVAATQIALENVVVDAIKYIWQKIVAFIKGIINFFKKIWNSIFGDSDKLKSDIKEAKKEIEQKISEKKENGPSTSSSSSKSVKTPDRKPSVALMTRIANEFEKDGKTDLITVRYYLNVLTGLSQFTKRMADGTFECIVKNNRSIVQIRDSKKTPNNPDIKLGILRDQSEAAKHTIVDMAKHSNFFEANNRGFISKQIPGGKKFVIVENKSSQGNYRGDHIHTKFLEISTQENLAQGNHEKVELLTLEQASSLLDEVEHGSRIYDNNIANLKDAGERISNGLRDLEKLAEDLSKDAIKNFYSIEEVKGRQTVVLKDGITSDQYQDRRNLHDLYHGAAGSIKFYIGMARDATLFMTRSLSVEKKAYTIALLYARRACVE